MKIRLWVAPAHQRIENFWKPESRKILFLAIRYECRLLKPLKSGTEYGENLTLTRLHFGSEKVALTIDEIFWNSGLHPQVDVSTLHILEIDGAFAKMNHLSD